MKNNKGFTLIELIMVTVILGILATAAVARYMNTVDKAEVAAERAVIDALRNAVEEYSNDQYIEHGRYDYPTNPFDLVDVDGYCGSCAGQDGLDMVDGSWRYVHSDDLGTIVHQRRDNSRYKWTYSTADDSDADSDDSGTNIGDGDLLNAYEVTNQSNLSN
mgnify:FL=1